MRGVKMLYLAAGMLCCSLFMGCFEVEEKTSFTSATTGNYALSVDAGEMIARLKMFGGAEQLKELPVQDTIIKLSDLLLQDTVLNLEEREAVMKGSVQLRINKDSNAMKLTMTNQFESLAQLNASRDVLLKVFATMGNASMPAMEGLGPASAGVLSLLNLKKLGVSQKASPGLLTQKVDNANTLSTRLAGDSAIQQIQQMTALMGTPVVFKQGFSFAKPIQQYTASHGTLSDDKKSILIRNTLDDLLSSPASFNYEIRY